MAYYCYIFYESFKECRLNVWLWRTIAIFQLIFGTFGSVMSIIVLSRKRLQKYSTTVYLIVLAIADLGTLWSAIFISILVHGFGVDLKVHSRVGCKTIDLVGYTAAGYSIWLLVLLTFERVMLTRFPVFSKNNLTRKSALITALVCLTLLISLFTFLPFGLDIKDIVIGRENVTQRSCVPSNTDYEYFYNHSWPIILFFVFSLIPIPLLLIGNGLIISTLLYRRRKLCTVNTTANVHQTNTYQKTKSSTRIIVLISTFFILTTLPYIFKRALESKLPAIDDKEIAQRILSKSVFTIIINFNYTFNFIVYRVSGTIFYEEFQKNCLGG